MYSPGLWHLLNRRGGSSRCTDKVCVLTLLFIAPSLGCPRAQGSDKSATENTNPLFENRHDFAPPSLNPGGDLTKGPPPQASLERLGNMRPTSHSDWTLPIELSGIIASRRIVRIGHLVIGGLDGSFSGSSSSFLPLFCSWLSIRDPAGNAILTPFRRSVANLHHCNDLLTT